MLFVKFMHFLLGYVRFTAEGGFPERFINLCSRSGIPLWNLMSRKGVLHANTGIKGYKAIRPAARKSGMRVRISRRIGLPFFLKKNKKRTGLLLGFFGLFILVLYLSTMIWMVEVQGNDRIPDEVILEVFEDLGVKPGMKSGKIDVNNIETLALDRLPDITWLTLNLKGSAAVIEVRETVPVPENPEKKDPCDIVALRDGQIVILETFQGTQVKKPGDAILEGELLISGITDNRDLTVDFRHAEGYAAARTERKITAETPAARQVRTYTGSKKQFTLRFFGLRIPFGFFKEPKGKFEVYESKKWFEANKVKLPVIFEKKEYVFYTESVKKTAGDEAKLAALESYNRLMEASLKNTEILKQSVFTKPLANGGFAVEGGYLCLENIGVERPLRMEETPGAQPQQ